MSRTPQPTEYQEQCAVIRWARMMAANGHPELALLHGDASGVRVPVGLAVKMKLAGAVRGWPDLFLPVARGRYHGLFIELKRLKGGVVTEEQTAIAIRLIARGYRVEICCGADSAIRLISEYVGIK